MKRFIIQSFIACTIVIVASLVGGGKTVYAGGTTSVYGGGGCVPVYGGGVQCPRAGQVLVEKKVRNPATNIFVDNLGLSDPKYLPQQIVTFQITVKNSGDDTLPNVTVTDTLPQFIDFSSGPGSFDGSTRTLNFTVSNIAGGTSQTFEVKARVVHVAALPAEKSIICPVNVVDASSNAQKDHDESQFCIEKQVVMPTVPKAGPEHWLASLAGLGTVFSLGLYFRKKAGVI